MNTIKAAGLCKRVTTAEGELVILHDVDINLMAREAIAVVGPSGSGKSTLLALLAGLDSASDGEIELLGSPLHQLDEDGRAAVRAGQVGFVFQSFQLLPGLTALENVMLPLELAAIGDARARAAAQLDKVGLQNRQQHLPSQLSGGEQQRVALARAFVTEPKVLFADEPTGNLDRNTGDTIVELMFNMRAESGCALVLVTHDQRLASRCDRIVTMTDGRLQ
ncbi:hypothetical protein AB833_32435 [Chromatiales bacterium (ex Bugula neritina AB1)]|nr:hypothetical protein AB833_32435 [Chromatiales bacterium (ex Bugula neritina AB1)]